VRTIKVTEQTELTNTTTKEIPWKILLEQTEFTKVMEQNRNMSSGHWSI
jgi:hypothetical protein